MKTCPVCDHSLADEEMTCSQCGFSFYPVLGLSAEQANQRLLERRQQWQAQHSVNSQPETTQAPASAASVVLNGVNINSGLVNLEKDNFETMAEYKKRLETGYWEVGNLRMLVDEYNSEKSIMPVEISLLPMLQEKLSGYFEDDTLMNLIIYLVIDRSVVREIIAIQEKLTIYGHLLLKNRNEFELEKIQVGINGFLYPLLVKGRANIGKKTNGELFFWGLKFLLSLMFLVYFIKNFTQWSERIFDENFWPSLFLFSFGFFWLFFYIKVAYGNLFKDKNLRIRLSGK